MADLFRFRSVSRELQLLIVESCDMTTLYQLCLTCRDMYEMAWPNLWRTIDFVNVDNSDNITEWQRRFFATCDIMMEDDRERWDTIAPRVEHLRLSRLPGHYVLRESPRTSHGNIDEWEFWEGGQKTTIFDIMAHFTKLETLTLFVKNDWDGAREDECRALENGLTNLRTLKIGGQIDSRFPAALLSHPEKLEELSLINLVEMCDQHEGPDPLLFLKPIEHRFTHLRNLHLSKLADLDLRDEYDEEPERKCLEEWAGLLQGVTKTLERLTLEMCYCRFGRGQHNDEQHQEYHSEDQFRDMLLPVLLESRWAKLKQITFIGLDVMKPLDSLEDQIRVEHLPRKGMLSYDYDATPLRVSPPSELFIDDWLDIEEDDET